MYVCMYVYVCIGMYTRAYTVAYIHMYIHTVCMYACNLAGEDRKEGLGINNLDGYTLAIINVKTCDYFTVIGNKIYC